QRAARGFHARTRRGREHLRRQHTAQSCQLALHRQQRLRGLAATEFVGLGQQHVAGQRVRGAERQHLLIEWRQRMADVHHQRQRAQAAASRQVMFECLAPLRAHGLGHLGVAIARQIHQTAAIGQ
ncbi:hypothetical protein B2A_09100, partial [mine drainage metagenome]